MDHNAAEFEPVLTWVACFFAVCSLAFVAYLAWRRFGPHRRHRRHRSRLRRYMGH